MQQIDLGLHRRLDELQHQDVSTLDDDDLLREALAAEETINRLEAVRMQRLAEVKRRRGCNGRGYRATVNLVTAVTRQNKRSVSYRLNTADVAVNRLPDVAAALAASDIGPDHVREFVRLYNRPELRPQLEIDLRYLLAWASEQWPVFLDVIHTWEVLADPTDPADLDEQAQDNRRLVWAQGLDRTVLAEIVAPNLQWEEFLTLAQPVFDRLLEQDWRDARARFGDEATGKDLARTDTQRWFDAAWHLMRAGAGRPDPGVQPEVVIVVDERTLADQARNAPGLAGAQVDPRPTLDAHRYRCETLSGLPVSPETALLAAVVGSIRVMTRAENQLNFTMSRRARLFNGPKRLGLIIRDRYCQQPGCQTPAHRCQADHDLAYSRGGPTLPTNGRMRCPACHRRKSHLESMGLWPEKPWPERPPEGQLTGINGPSGCQNAPSGKNVS